MAELDRASISIRMQQARDQAGLTQAEIAELLSPPVHFRSVQDWESPKMHVVPFDRLDEWARLTQTSREWLLYGESEEAVTPAIRDLTEVTKLLAEVARELRSAIQDLRQLREGEQPPHRESGHEPH